MTLTIRHATLSNVQDEGVPGEIGPSEWNESHTITDSDPIVILATGQSNFVQTPAFAWSPEPRAKKWNYNHTDGNVGTAFVPLPSSTINVADKFASEIARLNSTRQVYLINTATALSGNTIQRWLPGATGIDNYLQITNNVPVALAAIGATKIDLLLWWQGEAQTPATGQVYNYPTDWQAFHGRLLNETWFQRSTPVIIFGLAPSSISTSSATDVMNGKLQEVVRNDADCRRFVYLGLLGAPYWLDTAHMTGVGYDTAGRIAAAEYVYGATRSPLLDPLTNIARPQVLGRTTARNLFLGGDFTTNPWQRGTSFVSAPNGQFGPDRWRWTQVGSGVVDISKTADAPTLTQAGTYTQHCLDIAVTTADASMAATDQYFIRQILEGLNMAFLGFGQTSARPITISFWVKSTKTGTFWASIRNQAGDRSYATQYTINSSNVWERKEITIPGDVSGTWQYDNQHGLSVTWLLACGSNFISTPDSWNGGNFLAGGTVSNALDTIGNRFKLALAQIEEGIGASPFEALPQDILLDRCRRYYRKSFAQATAPAQNVGSTVGAAFAVSHVASAVFGTRVEFDTSMRAAPTITTYNPSASNANWRDTTNSADRTVTVSDQSEGGFVVIGAAGVAAASNYIHWQATADL